MKVTKEMSEQIVMMYQNKVKWRDIAAHFSISTYTVKQVLDKYGKDGRPSGKAPAFRAKISIDGPEGDWLAQQEDVNEAIRQLVKDKIAYSQIEGTSQKQNSRIADSGVEETNSPYSETEGTQENLENIVLNYLDNDDHVISTTIILAYNDAILLKNMAAKIAEEKNIHATTCQITDKAGNLIAKAIL